MTAPHETFPSDAGRDVDAIERHPCPRCTAEPGSPCRSRSGAVAGTYHTGRFTKVARLAKLLRVPTPADRGPGQPWRPGTPVPLALAPDTPTADIRIGYARCSSLTQELQSQLDALAAHGIGREKIFSEKISTRVRVRPQFEAALALARQIKAHAPHCRVIFTVYEMKRLGRDAAELTALADHLTAHGLVLEMLAGPLPGMYDPSGPGRLLFAFFAAMAETERENIRESTLEGLDAAARKGKHGGRPPVITDDMLHTVLRRRANGESVEQIQPDLIIPTGKRKGQAPSVASIYRALAEHEKRQAYPEAVAQAHADFAGLHDADDIPRPHRTRIRRPDDPLTPEQAELRQRLQDQALQPAHRADPGGGSGTTPQTP
ncbi:recombinase family protein [Nonomuraea lactucae]|uniref:recombinase family protein n=1 Tax=Nonomuraea lactucae TaxID=2249762 RepID=UPI000DE338F5|nr:recombinase family protein [Nonomuraea lactucae]